MRTESEEYWFNVGGLTGMFAIFIVILPCLFLTGFIRDLASITDKLVYGITPMLGYLLFLLWKSESVINICERLAIQEMKRKKKQ